MSSGTPITCQPISPLPSKTKGDNAWYAHIIPFTESRTIQKSITETEAQHQINKPKPFYGKRMENDLLMSDPPDRRTILFAAEILLCAPGLYFLFILLIFTYICYLLEVPVWLFSLIQGEKSLF